jgi:hypothetical protein
LVVGSAEIPITPRAPHTGGGGFTIKLFGCPDHSTLVSPGRAYYYLQLYQTEIKSQLKTSKRDK